MNEHLMLAENVFRVGAQDWDRRLFDDLIPLPDGTSYNSYLVTGKSKTALIDTVAYPKRHILLGHLHRMGIDKIDIIVCNHAEPDHSGSLSMILNEFPGAEVMGTEKCLSMLQDLELIGDSKTRAVADGDTVSLGDLTLEFIHTPWVHWPETMLTFLREREILFTCDLFGSHLATSDLFAVDKPVVLGAAKRYYAEIMMPFQKQIVKHLQRIKDYPVSMIAPSHGPVYGDPDLILDSYTDWTSSTPKDLVVIVYTSMHGSTRLMIEYLLEIFREKGLKVRPYNLTVSDIGELAADLVDAASLVVGSPIVLGGLHPNLVLGLYLANALKPKLRHIGVVGSMGWGGKHSA